MTTISEICNKLIKEYNNKFIFGNGLSDTSHQNKKYNHFESVVDHFTWPGEKIQFGIYYLKDLTWDILRSGQVFELVQYKNDNDYAHLLNGFDFTLYAGKIRRVMNEEDWHDVFNYLKNEYGENVKLEYTSWGFKPISEELDKEIEQHNKAMSEYMNRECALGHFVD